MTDRLKKVLILGTRTFAEEIADVASEIPGVEVVGFVENMDKQRCRQKLAGLPVFWIDEIAKFAKTHYAVSGLGTTQRNIFTDQIDKYNIPFTKLIHPSARVSKKSSLGKGTILSVGAIVAANSHLGEHVVVNRGATIGHHTIINSFVSIGPNANVAGNCRVGSHVYIGIGATMIDHISVGDNSIIAAGAVVVKDVPDRVMVAGVPAKIIKENVDNK
jgi:acetyltransferase EpsM